MEERAKVVRVRVMSATGGCRQSGDCGCCACVARCSAADHSLLTRCCRKQADEELPSADDGRRCFENLSQSLCFFSFISYSYYGVH